MAESVPVRCPACRREHLYAAPSFPCACGAPVTPALDRHAIPESVTHRTWDEDWVTVRCPVCGREDQWPRPELGCSCGTVLRMPVAETPSARGHTRPAEAGTDAAAGSRPAQGTDDGESASPRAANGPNDSDASAPRGAGRGTVDEPEAPDAAEGADHPTSAATSASPPAPAPTPRIPLPRTAPTARPAFQPVTIRTARDAVTAAALYLRWLGYQDIRRADQRPPTGIGLAASGVLAQVDPSLNPATLRDVECLWLTAMTESVRCVYFSLAGYADDARSRADTLGVPLFVLDLTGTPQPVNSLADELIATGA